jgi:hypothetical protein
MEVELLLRASGANLCLVLRTVFKCAPEGDPAKFENHGRAERYLSGNIQATAGNAREAE